MYFVVISITIKAQLQSQLWQLMVFKAEEYS